MGRYVLTRLATSVALFFAITLFVFVAFYVVPQNPSRPGTINTTYKARGSLPHQYAHYIWHFVRYGDLGTSYATRDAVTTRLFRAAPVTISLLLGGMIVWLLIAIPPS